jgi:hypothetical protein
MAQYDKDNDPSLNTPHTQKHIDKPKGEMSIREAASMEMQDAHIETRMRGIPVHGFGDGQADTPKRHTPPSDWVEMPMQGSMQRSAGESVTDIIDHVLHLPFHAQLSVLRMIAPRILGAMDARDREGFMSDLRTELGTTESEAHTATSPLDMQNFQGQ